MVRTRNRLVICTVLLMIILAFIWGNSAMPGETSGALSGWVGELLSRFFPFLATENGLHILRKLAHFSEFAALGMCLGWLFGMVMERKILKYALPFGCGVAAACIDETIQIFSPGRYCSFIDVGIDSAGVLTGIVLLVFGYAVCKSLRKKTGGSAMKKLLSVLLALILCAGVMTGCRRTEPEGTTTAPASASALAGKSLSEIMDMVYEKHPVELPLITIDLALEDAYTVKSYLGLDSSELVQEAVASESGFGSQAYSLVLCRVKDPANAQTVARQMFDGIDRRKWICVEADDLMVSVFGDLVLLVMIDSDYAEMATARQLTDAFASINGASAELTLKD